MYLDYIHTWGIAMMDVNIVYNNIAYILQRNATTSDNMHISSTAIKRLVAIEDELLWELYQHILREHYPQRLFLDHRVTQSPRLGRDHVVVGVVGDDVILAVLAAERVLAEANGAVGQALAVVGPIGVAFPAVVDGVAGQAGGVGQHLSSRHGSVHFAVGERGKIVKKVFCVCEMWNVWRVVVGGTRVRKCELEGQKCDKSFERVRNMEYMRSGKLG